MKLLFNADETIHKLLRQEDTDGDKKITVEDEGPQFFKAESVSGHIVEIKGYYYLSNFLQELILASDSGKEVVEINTDYIFEKPVDRINRMIKDYYWEGLTRKLDGEGLVGALVDEKFSDNDLYLYVPENDKEAQRYYREIIEKIREHKITLLELSNKITPGYVNSLNNKSGVVSLALGKNKDGQTEALPFVVPGGRFNEMYGWDSYFEALGLIIDDKIDLAKAMADNFVYEIKHYGQILNANRTYYLTRSQPPFLTSFARLVYNNMPRNEESRNWLRILLDTSITEYKTVWMTEPKLTSNGLSRYYGKGIGLPPETEKEHFDTLLKPFAQKAGMDIRQYHKKYLNREIIEPEIEEYIIHDRSIRESGHDTSYRLDRVCAHLNTVDLNSLLYKYETDIAELIKNEFDNQFITQEGTTETAGIWLEKAAARKEKMNSLMWNEAKGFYFDYNFAREEQTHFESATAFYPLWAKLAGRDQAAILVKKGLESLEFAGGIAGASKESAGEITAERPQKQWDYPNGWAPHQILIWEGLSNYGYETTARRLAYKWLYTILRNAVAYNGTIPEKFDVVSRSHKVFAEYGNVGTEFDYITREGFGWMNASFKVGQKYLTEELIEKLNDLVPPEEIF